MPLLIASILQQIGDLVVIMIVVGLALYGWQHGLFLATLAGLQVLGSFLAAIALADAVAPLLAMADCPPSFAFPAAFLLIFFGGVVALRLAVGATVPEGAVRFSEWVDRIGGLLVGAIAGWVLAGAVLVSWSMAPLTDAFVLRGTELRLDPGSWLVSKAACRSLAAENDADELRDRLLRCYATGNWDERFPPPAPPEPPADGGAAAEGSGAETPADPPHEPVTPQP